MNFELSDALKAKLDQTESLEEVVKVCAEEGVEVTLEQLQAAMNSQSEELGEEDLDNVAGGVLPLVAGIAVIAVTTYLANKYGRTHAPGWRR